MTTRLPLGQLLVDARMITAEALADVLAAQKQDGRRLGTLLVERGLINEAQLTQILSHQLSVPWVSLLHIEFSRQLLNLVPRDVAERFCLVPIYVRHVRGQGQTLYVAMDDPTNEEALRECQSFSGLPVRAMIAPPTDIRNAIRVYYGGGAPRPAPPPPPEVTPRPVGEAPRARRSERPSRRLTPVPGIAVPAAPPVPSEASVAPFQASAPTQAASPPPPAPEPPSPSPPPKEASAGAAVQARAELQTAATPSEPAGAIPTGEAPRKSRGTMPSSPDDPEIVSAPIPKPKGRSPRMVSLTLLDGTSITLPARRPRGEADSKRAEEAQAGDAESSLTARDLVAALRAVSHGADASEILGSNVRWEAMFAALLSVLLKKHLIADWEFVDEFRKI